MNHKFRFISTMPNGLSFAYFFFLNPNVKKNNYQFYYTLSKAIYLSEKFRGVSQYNKTSKFYEKFN